MDLEGEHNSVAALAPLVAISSNKRSNEGPNAFFSFIDRCNMRSYSTTN